MSRLNVVKALPLVILVIASYLVYNWGYIPLNTGAITMSEGVAVEDMELIFVVVLIALGASAFLNLFINGIVTGIILAAALFFGYSQYGEKIQNVEHFRSFFDVKIESVAEVTLSVDTDAIEAINRQIVLVKQIVDFLPPLTVEFRNKLDTLGNIYAETTKYYSQIVTPTMEDTAKVEGVMLELKNSYHQETVTLLNKLAKYYDDNDDLKFDKSPEMFNEKFDIESASVEMRNYIINFSKVVNVLETPINFQNSFIIENIDTEDKLETLNEQKIKARETYVFKALGSIYFGFFSVCLTMIISFLVGPFSDLLTLIPGISGSSSGNPMMGLKDKKIKGL